MANQNAIDFRFTLDVNGVLYDHVRLEQLSVDTANIFAILHAINVALSKDTVGSDSPQLFDTPIASWPMTLREYQALRAITNYAAQMAAARHIENGVITATTMLRVAPTGITVEETTIGEQADVVDARLLTQEARNSLYGEGRIKWLHPITEGHIYALIADHQRAGKRQLDQGLTASGSYLIRCAESFLWCLKEIWSRDLEIKALRTRIGKLECAAPRTPTLRVHPQFVADDANAVIRDTVELAPTEGADNQRFITLNTKTKCQMAFVLLQSGMDAQRQEALAFLKSIIDIMPTL